jgi:hypothetical protein
MSSAWQKILLIASICTFVAAYSLWPLLWHGSFYQLLAISIVLWMALIKDLCPQGLKKFARVGFWISVNNLMDELFFDPTKFAINEYIFAAFILLAIFNKNSNAKQTRTI